MWKEHAVAVERQHGEAVIICEGPLAAVVATLQPIGSVRFSGIRVSLPDRRAAPSSFERKTLHSLLDDPARPKATSLRLLPATIPIELPDTSTT